MKEQDEFEPLIIKGGKFGTPAPEYRLEIAKQTVKAVEFACRYKVKYVIACIILSPTVGGMNMATSLAMDDTDYLENLDGCLPTLEEAEACLALSQLCQWRDKYNEGWKPDWSNSREHKWTVGVCLDIIKVYSTLDSNAVLSFKTSTIRDKFVEDFRELIETAKPLL